MKPEHSFIAERALAQHCPELLRQRPAGAAPADLLSALGRAGAQLSRTLAGALAPFLDGHDPAITVGDPREGDPITLMSEIAPLAANSLLAAGIAASPLLVSLDAAAVLRILDRAFGGKGKTPSPLPEVFPHSAGILVKQLESLVADGLAEALGIAAIQPIRRDGALAQLEPFAEATPLVIMTLAVEEAGQQAWPLVIALPMASLAELFGDGAQAVPRTVRPRQTNPAEQPYCDLPLTLSAVIVDMQLPMSALTELRPGTILPVSVARNVPLRIAGKTIAHGVIGAVDDRVAIEITQAF